MKTIFHDMLFIKRSLKNFYVGLVLIVLLFMGINTNFAQVVYIANSGNNEVVAYDVSTQTSTPISLTFSPVKVDAAPDGSQIAVVGATTIAFIDPADNSVLSSAPVPSGAEIRDVFYSTDGSLVFTIDQLTTLLTPINTSTFVPGSFGFLFTGVAPIAGAVDPLTGTIALVNNGTGDVATFMANPIVQSGLNIAVGPSPQDITFLPNTSSAYVTNFNGNSVSVVDLSTRSATTIGGQGNPNFISNPVGIVASSDGANVYVTENGTDQVAIIATSNNMLDGRFDVGMDPRGITISEDDATLAVANFGGNSISIVDIASGNVSTVDNLSGPLSVAIITPMVDNPPMAAFTADPTSGDAPLTVNFDASTSSDDNGVTSYSWDFGDGNTATGETTSNTYDTPGDYTVTLVVADEAGQADTATQVITVTMANESPTAAFDPAFASATVPLTVDFDASASSDPDGTIESYAWDFGDGNTGNGVTISYTYNQPGEYTVTLIVTDNLGAMDTATASIIAAENELPTAVLTAEPTSGVIPLTVSFDGTGSSDPEGTDLTYAWDFGDGNSADTDTTSNIYTVAGNYLVTLTVTDGFGNSATDTVTIFATDPANMAPMASFTATPDAGNAPLEVSFDASASSDSDGTIESYAWDFGDGNMGTGVMPTNTYTSPGIYMVSLTVTDDNGAVATTTSTITVNNPPSAMFTATPESGLAPLDVAFDASASMDTDGTIIEFNWDFGDGNTATGMMASNTYTSGGSFEATLVVVDNGGATDTATVTISVNDLPVASFTAEPTSGDAPLEVSFDASASSDPNGTIESYAWDFGDGNMGTGVTATNAYINPGTYTVTLTVTDNEGATAMSTTTITVTVAPIDPIADFTVVPGSGNAPVTVTVDASTSTDPDGTIESYAWDFGDGNTATGVMATNEYVLAGTYTITLTVTDNSGATSTATRNFTVLPPLAIVQQELQDTLENQTLTEIVGLNFGGITASVVTSSGEQFDIATGQATPAVPMNTEQRIGIADVSQTVLTALALALRDEGKISLDQEIGAFLNVNVLNNIPANVTIRQLLSNTSGIASFADNSQYETSVLFDVTRVFDPVEVVNEFVGAAGSRGSFSYSNTNFLLLGLILEAVNEEETLQGSLDRLISGPAGVTGLEFYVEEDPSDLIPLFADVSGFGFLQQLTPNTSIFTGASYAGNIMATPAQTIKLMKEIASGNVLSPESLTEMLTFTDIEGRLSNQYGLGVENFSLNIGGIDVDFVGHIGDVNYGSVLLYSPDFETGVSLVTNNGAADQESILELARKLLSVVLDQVVDVDDPQVEEDLAAQMVLFPNPANQSIRVELPDVSTNNAVYSIIDFSGRLVKGQSFEWIVGGQLEINTNDLAIGTYLLQIAIDNNVLTKKFMIQR